MNTNRLYVSLLLFLFFALPLFSPRGSVDADDALRKAHPAMDDPYFAVRHGYLPQLKAQIEKNPELVRKNKGGIGTLLHAAAFGEQGQEGEGPSSASEIIEYLVSKGAKVDARDGAGQTPLHNTATWGALEAAKTLVRLGADPKALRRIDEDDTEGFSVLAIAAKGGHIDVVKFLLEQGAPVRHGDGKYGDTALHWAACADIIITDPDKQRWEHRMTNAEVIDLLAQKLGGVDIPSKRFQNHTPLEIAADMNQPGVVKHLLENYLDEIDVEDIESAMNLARTPPGTISFTGNDAVADAMLKLLRDARDAKRGVKKEAGGDNEPREEEPCVEDQEGTAERRRFNHAFLAAMFGDLESLRKIVEEDPDLVRATDRSGRTLLHHAVMNHRPKLKLVEYLISKGAEVDARESGETPLFEAASRNALDVAKVLVRHGADVNTRKDLSERVPGEGMSVLSAATRRGNVELVKLLLEKGARVEYGQGTDRETALHWAAFGVYGRRDGKLYPLSNAAVIDLLAERTGDINIRDGFGRTPLHRAAQTGAVETVRHLLESYPNIKVNAKDHRGETPLDYATDDAFSRPRENRIAIIALLLKHGADPNLPNGQGGQAAFDSLGSEPTAQDILRAMGLWEPVEAGKPTTANEQAD